MTGIQRLRFGPYLHYFLTAADFLIINLAFIITFRFDGPIASGQLRTALLLCNAAYFPVAYWFRSSLKSRSIHIDRQIAGTIRALAVHALIFISALYFVGIDNISFTAFANFYGICFLVFPVWRTVCRLCLKAYRRNGRNFRQVAIIGTNTTAQRLLEIFNTDVGLGYRFIGFFDDNPSPAFDGKQYKGNLTELATYMNNGEIDEVFYTLSGEDESSLQKAISIADSHSSSFYYVPQVSRYLTRGFHLTEFGSMPVLSVRRNPQSLMANRILKRLLDICVSSVALTLFPLVLIPASVAIKLSSPGPVFFRQKRTGYKGKEFECIKLRTMRVNNSADSVQATVNDPRKTKIGNFLRRTSLDELPQFWNVLRGDMSVVGPRPHMLRHSEIYSSLIDKYSVRHIVKPGITGWAQVNGYRGETRHLWQMEKRVEYDVFYIENWSLLFDIKIICRTMLNTLHEDQNAF